MDEYRSKHVCMHSHVRRHVLRLTNASKLPSLPNGACDSAFPDPSPWLKWIVPPFRTCMWYVVHEYLQVHAAYVGPDTLEDGDEHAPCLLRVTTRTVEESVAFQDFRRSICVSAAATR